MLLSLVSSERGLKSLTRGMLNLKYLYISASVGNSFFPNPKRSTFYIFCIYGERAHVCHRVYVQIRRQHLGIGSDLPPVLGIELKLPKFIATVFAYRTILVAKPPSVLF